MKLILFSSLLFISFISKSQTLGYSKDKVLDYLHSNIDVKEMKINYGNPNFNCFISYQSITGYFVCTALFFNENDICSQKSITYLYSFFDLILQKLNRDYVKITETKWAYYTDTTTTYFLLEKEDDSFTIKSYFEQI